MTEIRIAPVGTPLPADTTVYDANWQPIGTLAEPVKFETDTDTGIVTAAIPYDEMRAILGLPDVKCDVERMRAQLAFQRLQKSTAAIATALTTALDAAAPAMDEMRSAIARAAAASAPPMWAIDPARTRRRRNR